VYNAIIVELAAYIAIVYLMKMHLSLILHAMQMQIDPNVHVYVATEDEDCVFQMEMHALSNIREEKVC